MNLKPLSVPLYESEGALLVQGTRVPLDTVVHAFERGATPEEIAQRFPVALAHVYCVIGFYLQNRSEVEVYLQRRCSEAQEVREHMEARFPRNGLRERLLARRDS